MHRHDVKSQTRLAARGRWANADGTLTVLPRPALTQRGPVSPLGAVALPVPLRQMSPYQAPVTFFHPGPLCWAFRQATLGGPASLKI